MPPVVAAVTIIATNVGLVSAAGAVAFLGSTAFVVASWAVTIGAAVAYSAAQQRKMKKQMAALNASIDQSRSIMVRDPIALRRYVQGQVLVSGPIVYMAVTGTNNEYLHLVIVMSDGLVEELGDIYFGATVVPLDGSGNATGTYAGYATVKKFLGATAGERDTDLETATSGEWTATHLGKGVARIRVTLKHSVDLYPEGIPIVRCMVKGIKHYDPRTATTVWSANGALAVRTFLADEKFGKGIDSARILTAPAEEAANVCDEDVVLADLSTENRYESHGVVYSGDAETTLAELCGAMAGHVCDAGGKWTIRAGAWRTPTVSFSESDLAGGFNMLPRQSRQDSFNGVRGTYISALNQWAPSDFPVVKNDTYMAWDGNKRLWKDVAYNFTISHAMAQRLAKIDLERGRQQIIWDADFMLKAVKVQPGDVIEFTKVNLGWTGKYFEVLRWVFKIVEGKGGAALRIGLQVRETAAAVFDWADGEETTVDLAANTGLFNPRSVPALAGFSATVATTAERTALPRVKCSWTAPSASSVTEGGYTEIDYRLSGDPDWIQAARVPGSVTFIYINDLLPGETYNFRARHVNVYGVRGSYGTDNEVAEAGQGSYTALLTNEAHSVSCDAGGTPIAGELGSGGRAFSDVLAFAGSLGLTAVTSAPGIGQFAISIATHSGTATWTKVDDDTVRCDSISTDSAVGRVTIDLEGVLTVYKDFTVTKVNSGTDGDPGTDGDDATVYWLVPDAAAVNKTIAGSYTPSTLNLSAYNKTGAAAPAAYSGRFKIATFDGSTWTDVYTSAGDESTKAYTVPASILAIRCRLYLAGGTTTLVDEQIVPIVTDGATGATGPAGSNGAAVAADNGSFSTIGLNAGSQSTCVTVSKTPVSTSCLVSAACTMENLDAVADSGVTVRVYRDSTVIGTFENFDLSAYETMVGTPLVIADTGLTGGVTYSYTIKAYRTVSGATIDCQSCSLSIVG